MQYRMHGGLYDRIIDMPKKAKELSGLAVSRLKTEGSFAVGGVDGLYLRNRGQSRSWILCVAMGVRVNARGKTVPKRLNLGLGPYPEVSLAEARKRLVNSASKSGMELTRYKKNMSALPNK